ncbi:polysaccharide biosynthesis/export family protein [Saccharicrinis sp. FJH62]|uniref:polysaccharide biosynthesis/export family protein n=1 Tax=Saccharicrinis sp. FJH62 TaxID=3344657 RepID=UPI0035D48805
MKDITYLQDISNREVIIPSKNMISEYKLRQNDNLYINIKTLDPEVNILFSTSGQTGNMMTGTTQMYGNEVGLYINGYQLDSVGNITLPILGTINIMNLTLDEAKNKIYVKANEYLQDPVVAVKLLSFKIQISGEVNKPGIYYYYEGSMTILDAITMAGGITDEANIRNVYIIRQKNNTNEIYNIDLTNKKAFSSEAYYLYPNDMIYVKPGFNKKYSLNVQTYQLILSTISTLVGLQFLYQPIDLGN